MTLAALLLKAPGHHKVRGTKNIDFDVGGFALEGPCLCSTAPGDQQHRFRRRKHRFGESLYQNSLREVECFEFDVGDFALWGPRPSRTRRTQSIDFDVGGFAPGGPLAQSRPRGGGHSIESVVGGFALLPRCSLVGPQGPTNRIGVSVWFGLFWRPGETD